MTTILAVRVIRFRGPDFPNYLFSPETRLHEGTALELGPTPHSTPWGAFPTPRSLLAVPPPMGFRGGTCTFSWKRGARAYGMRRYGPVPEVMTT
jgi:hypothetical protein